MKKFALAAAAVVLSVSAISFAKDTTASGSLCVIKADGDYNGQIVDGREFFSKAVAWSNSNNTCVIAKIYNEAETSRLYYNGHRLGDRDSGMSNSEIDQALSMYYVSSSSCTTFSCVRY